MTVISEATLANERERRQQSLRLGYVPPEELVCDPSLAFFDEVDTELDTVTYEVLRSKLWNLNIDHSDTIRRVSGSNIVVEGLDYNCAVTNATGDAVTSSPYTLFFAGYTDEVIKWTLEHRSMNVGIRDADLFLQDDPWVGSNHQMDTAVYGPVFVDGKLFAWVFNCLHQHEIGGALPGGFVENAADVHAEPTFMPPVKLAENDVVREDIVDMWIRRSRLPELMALELNSQVSGFRTARARLLEIVRRYGAGAVKAAMERMIDDTAQVVGDRLALLPDATWRDERYLAGATAADTNVHRLCLTFTKTGQRVRVSNGGTDPAFGAFNISRGNFRASVLNGFLLTIAYDQYLCAAGVLRQLDFDYADGAITSAPHPAGVSTSLGSVATINQAHLLCSKMISGHPELATHAFASSGLHTLGGGPAVVWRDPWGNMAADSPLDLLAGGIGAFNHRDGIDYGGSVLAVAHHFSDVEKFEQAIPFLYLYRREARDSGGHGSWRGGVTFSVAWVAHKVDGATCQISGLAKSVTGGIGMGGGYPATGGTYWYATDSDVQEWFRAGRLPGTPGELRQAAPSGAVATRGAGHRFSSTDVFELLPNPGAGWGDPLERDPELVAADASAGRVTLDDAARVYSVVLGPSGSADRAATEERRKIMRAERMQAARGPRRPTEGRIAVDRAPRVTEWVALVAEQGERSFACASCGRHLGPADTSYRHGCLELDIALDTISPNFLSSIAEVGEEVVFRRFLCPGCGRALDGQICLPSDLPYNDVTVDVSA